MFLLSASERPLCLPDSNKTKIEFFLSTGWIKWYTIPFTHSNDAYCSSWLWVLEFELSLYFMSGVSRSMTRSFIVLDGLPLETFVKHVPEALKTTEHEGEGCPS